MIRRLSLVALIAALPTPVLGQAIVADYVPSASASAASTGAFPVPNTVSGSGSNRLLVVLLSMETTNANVNNMNITSVTRGSQSLTRLTTANAVQVGTNNSNQSSIWYLFNPTADSTAVTVNTQGATARSTAAAFSFFNVLQNVSGIVGASATVDNASSVSTTFTPAAVGSWVLDVGTQGASGNAMTATGTSHTEYTGLENLTTMSTAFGRWQAAPASPISLGWSNATIPSDSRFLQSSISFAPVPEPATVLGVAAVALAIMRRCRRSS